MNLEKNDKIFPKTASIHFENVISFQDNDEWSTRDIRGHQSFIYYLYFCLGQPINADYYFFEFGKEQFYNEKITCDFEIV